MDTTIETAAARRWWNEHASSEFAGIDPARTIAIFPIAATEQHGPHLPVGVDSLLNRGFLAAMAEAAGDLDLRILPVQEIGKSDEHRSFPGTLTLPAPLLIEIWTQIGLCVARTGIRKMVIVSSHGGNDEVMGIVARELRLRAGMLVAKTAWLRFGKPPGLFSDRETRFGIHAGDVETSLMLHLHPDLVRMDRAADFRSAAEDDEAAHTHLRAIGPHAYAWLAEDLHPGGAVGEADRANAEKGRALLAHVVGGFMELLRDVERAALPACGTSPDDAPHSASGTG